MASSKSKAKNSAPKGNNNSPKAREAARRARVEEIRKTEQARERRMRLLTLGVTGVILAGLVGGGWYLIDAAQEKEEAKAAPVKGVKSWSKLTQNHVTEKVDYKMSPPVGGDHNQVWVNCDKQVYTKAVPNENAVHALEHGAVWITYNDKAAKADVESLSGLVNKTTYTFMSPYEDQSSPIVLSAWEHQLKVDKASDPRVRKFLDKYVQGEQTPEPGAACTGGMTP
ncbi:DUF3105 domain-containing protein [Streptomyces caniscabiei]|uniref:DUF3105 domain-containing protein n=1 Tax=Streptomyces caniscabiei TaxID=2746961 RepID=A0A927L4B0_9ACTN|nr:DUF3105 domain-containing protein [Streptomyces caniscabiei]MBD9725177.1 DUF3105 domain-containing protein [Streptomyces caniscabiei]MDX3510727.1 DUF3105 domain-containing protein [Streptomyces caniscabiei]MDX3720330.1 DUF3105 domain-containing protein [Streptomyces caniscabiei]WEO29428.1 DUF3105 domain-containing protein [Streptomyces caniscabiei]